MSVESYINPDFTTADKIGFFGVAFAALVFCVLLIIIGTKLSTLKFPGNTGKQEFYERAHNRVQRFYEMIISGTSVMSFSCAYIIINHIYALNGESGEGALGIVTYAWGEWKDFTLLLLICLSCVLNTILDRFIIPLKRIDKGEKASIRLLAMFYVIIVLLVLNSIGDESEYNPVMMYYLGLMVGRFVYFDASFTDFLEAIKNALSNLGLLVLGLLMTGGLSRYGFSKEYLLERNYYIVGVFYTSLFMLAGVFVLHHIHILNLLIRKPGEIPGRPKETDKNRRTPKEQYKQEYEEEYDEAYEEIYDEEYDEEYDEAYDDDFEYDEEYEDV